jgi:HEAT repeat protein
MINRLMKSKSQKAAPKARKVDAKSPVAATKTTTIAPQIAQLRADDWTARSAAVLALGKLGDCQATSALVATLRDPSAEVACGAATALGSLRDSSAVAALAAVVLNADGFFHGTVRAAAAEALTKFQDQKAVDALIVGTRDPIAETSQAAIRALGLLGDGRALDALVAVVRNKDNFFLPAVRQTAVEALSRLAADNALAASIRQAASAAVTTAVSPN